MDEKPKEEYVFESLLEEKEEKIEQVIFSPKNSSTLINITIVVLTSFFLFSLTSGFIRFPLIAAYILIVFTIIKMARKPMRGRLVLGISTSVVLLLVLLHSAFSTGTLYLVDDLTMETGMKIKIQYLGIPEEKLSKLIKKSSNSDVIAFEGNELVAKSPGEVTISFSDIFGNGVRTNYKVIESEVFSFSVSNASEISVGEERWIDVYALPSSYRTIDYDVKIIEGSEYGKIVEVESDDTSFSGQKIMALHGLKKGTMKLRVSTEELGYKDIIVKVSSGDGSFLISPILNDPSTVVDTMNPIVLVGPTKVLVEALSPSFINAEDLACSANGRKVDSFIENQIFELFVERDMEVVCTYDNKISNVLIFEIGGGFYD